MTECGKYIGGYVRLSRDDNKKNYISIENQKLIIESYAKEKGWSIDRWYEDDGFSGYSFQRPDFRRMVMDLEKDLYIIVAKDLSRIGRHNAKVLLFLEEIKEMERRIVLIDDHYDTIKVEDDTIGIKTWYNERYVKDASKKIRSVLKARQTEGSLIVSAPFGYLRGKNSKQELLIDEDTAPIVREIFKSYLNGKGFRAISKSLNEQGISTPSMTAKIRREREGKSCNKKTTHYWSAAMVGEILKNDFYMGTLRQHKRERISINGKEKKVKKEEQMVFLNNHTPLIEPYQFELVQQILKKRKETDYRGIKNNQNFFSGLLYCADCGCRLTAVNLKSGKKYYICQTYNKKGIQFCAYSHMVNEKTLNKSVEILFCEIAKLYENKMKSIAVPTITKLQNDIENKIKIKRQELEQHKKELKRILVLQGEDEKYLSRFEKELCNAYNEIKTERLNALRKTEESLNVLIKELESKKTLKGQNCWDVFQKFMLEGRFRRGDLEQVFEKIIVEKDGTLRFQLRFRL